MYSSLYNLNLYGTISVYMFKLSGDISMYKRVLNNRRGWHIRTCSSTIIIDTQILAGHNHGEMWSPCTGIARVSSEFLYRACDRRQDNDSTSCRVSGAPSNNGLEPSQAMNFSRLLASSKECNKRTSDQCPTQAPWGSPPKSISCRRTL